MDGSRRTFHATKRPVSLQLHPTNVARSTVRVRGSLDRAGKIEAVVDYELALRLVWHRPLLRELPSKHIGFRSFPRPPLVAGLRVGAVKALGVAGFALSPQEHIVVPPYVHVRVEAREDVSTAHLTCLAVANRAGAVVRPDWVPLPGRIDVDVVRIVAQRAVQRGVAPALLPGDAWAVIGLGATTGQRCRRFWRLASVAAESFLEHGVAVSCCEVSVVRLDAGNALRDTLRMLRGACCTQSDEAGGVAK